MSDTLLVFALSIGFLIITCISLVQYDKRYWRNYRKKRTEVLRRSWYREDG